MLLIRTIIGDVREARFSPRRIERLLITSADASKRRLRGRTDAGTDLGIDLERGAYLPDGVVLHDDGDRIIVVARKPEQALVIRLSTDLDYGELLRQALRLGHAFGNQHIPIEVADGEIRVPITTNEEIATNTVSALHLHGAEIAIELVQLGRERPLQAPAPGHHDAGRDL